MIRPRTDADLTEKMCSTCRLVRPIGDFRWVTPRPGRGRPHWASICKPCDRESSREWRANNRDRSRAAVRRWRLESLYGITPEDFDKMAEAQNGKCAICGKVPDRANPNHSRLKIDHDHDTGIVRGLLCNRCNLELGWMEAHKDAIEHYLAEAASVSGRRE